MDSTDSGTPLSKERIGAKQARRARQQSERERRTDRKRGGQPGHQGKGPRRDPEPDAGKDAGRPAQCHNCKAALDGAEAAGSRWAQVIDVEIVRKVTDWALPGLCVPVLRDGDVRGAAAGLACGRGVLRPGAERRGGAAVRLPERTARARRACPGPAAGRAGLRRVGGQGRRPGRAQLGTAGFGEAMIAADALHLRTERATLQRGTRRRPLAGRLPAAAIAG